MAERRASMTLSVSAAEKAALEELALAYGLQWGDKPNVSKLVKAIARGQLKIANNHDWGRDRTDGLHKAYGLLKDTGNFPEARILGELLVSRSELGESQRLDIQRWLSSPGMAWRNKIQQFKQKHCPFRLMYEDAAGQIWTYTVRFADVKRIEDREYLLCWCDETDHNNDVPELQHNWTLRLDRIPEEAELTPVKGDWRADVDYLNVTMHMIGGLKMSYRSKTSADMVNVWEPAQDLRRVERKIFSTFWFFREVRRYGKDCVIVGPDEVRDRFVADLLESVQNYELSEGSS